MGCFVPSTVASMYPIATTTTTAASLSLPSNPPSILDVPAIPKPPAPSKPSKTWAKPYPTPVPLLSPVELDWLSKGD